MTKKNHRTPFTIEPILTTEQIEELSRACDRANECAARHAGANTPKHHEWARLELNIFNAIFWTTAGRFALLWPDEARTQENIIGQMSDRADLSWIETHAALNQTTPPPPQ